MQHEQPLLTNRTNFRRWPWLLLLLVLAFPHVSLGQEPPDTNYDESKVPKYELPDPLVCFDGRPVSDAAMWRETRRPEILQAFAQHVYGLTPEIKTHLRFETIGADAKVFDGLATRKQIRIWLLDAEDAPWIDLLLYIPNHTSGPAPVFLGLNYGNQGVHPDPEIIPSRNAVCERGEHGLRWPLELLLKRGYAVASFHGGDIELDRYGSGCRFTDEGWQKGIRHFVMQQSGRTELADDEWGSLGAWAWGLSRALDYLQTDPTIDGNGVAVFGHSRTAKAALWAGAQDERFALVISNNSGQGGASLGRRRYGETVAASWSLSGIWYCRNYQKYGNHETVLPVDAHQLIASIAPRPVYVASAEQDRWADPRGEFLAALHAESVYELHGRPGLGVVDMPDVDRPVGRTIGYHVRTGDHEITPYDWGRYLDFADRHLRSRRVLYNFDGDSCLSTKAGGKGPVPVNVEDVKRLIEEVAYEGSQVDTILVCVNAQVMYYPTKVGTMRGTLSTAEERAKWPASEKQRFENLKAFFDSGVDPYAVMLSEAKRCGREALLTFRMNDDHGNDFLRTQFQVDHPEWRLGTEQYRGKGALDFGRDEVRDHMFRLIEEAVRRYDCDGIELDFNRFPTFFKDGTTEECVTKMNSLVERIRQMLDDVGRERGRRLVLSVRPPSNGGNPPPTPETARQRGCDVPAWVRNGWVDFVGVSEFLFERGDLPIDQWKQAIKTVPVYGGIECTRGGGQKNLTADEYRAAAIHLLKKKSDGIYLFNFFTSREEGEKAYEPPFEVLKDLELSEGRPQLNGGLPRPEVEYQVFQFPADRIPRIDGDAADWSIVPESYAIGQDQLRETVIGIGDKQDPKNLDVKVKVGWVKGQNHLYFLYEANDNYWDFAREDLHNDIFEVVIDGDLSGGPLIRQMHPQHRLRDKLETHFLYHGVHAQNYHIFTPAEGKDWAMVWGSQPWIKDLPYANAAYKYNFMPGDSGKLVLEFFVTPFDYAPPDPARAVQTRLTEEKVIGMSWAILDYDDEKAKSYAGFWNLSHKTTMYGDASDLVAFRLMPIEKNLRKPVEADWSFQVVSLDDRVVAFRDRSFGDITAWHWDFGDGTSSTERHPTHHYEKPGEFIVTLKIEGPAGKARRAKVWDVTLP